MRLNGILIKSTILTVMGCCCQIVAAEESSEHVVNWRGEIIATASSGQFAPYYVASNRHGVITQGKNALLREALWHEMDTAKRFSYSYGVDVIGGYGNNADYVHFNDNEWQENPQHPSRIWLQQLYGEVKYRGVFLSAGIKEHGSALLNNLLSSGDFVQSGNARPIPGVRVGFIDFQDIPFTNGWMQIQGEISYGKFTDNKWLRNHFNYYNGHINQGALYTYKRCYFRTKPSMPFSATFGMQVGAMFGGTTDYYRNGVHYDSTTNAKNIKQFFKMLLPTDGGTDYYSGSSLGSWDIHFRYRLRNGMEVMAYLQKPWEDGSGIGFLNGFDGNWGLEFKAGKRAPISGAVIEYLDFTNMSGPMHWDYMDIAGTTIQQHADGADNYYNNFEYNSYQNYGMAIGTPFLRSPIYNLNGDMDFLFTRTRGFHIGIMGEIGENFSYRMLGGYRRSWGTPMKPALTPHSDTSIMLEGNYVVKQIPGLAIYGQLALDHGNLYGNNFGGCITLSYSGILSIK